jgi:hypothetical protein
VIQNIFYFILFYYNFVYSKFIILYCILRGASFTTHMPKTLRLHAFVIFVAVSKQIKICCEGANRFVAETLLYLSHTHIQLLLLYITVKICHNKKWSIFAQFNLRPFLIRLRSCTINKIFANLAGN